MIRRIKYNGSVSDNNRIYLSLSYSDIRPYFPISRGVLIHNISTADRGPRGYIKVYYIRGVGGTAVVVAWITSSSPPRGSSSGDCICSKN